MSTGTAYVLEVPGRGDLFKIPQSFVMVSKKLQDPNVMVLNNLPGIISSSYRLTDTGDSYPFIVDPTPGYSAHCLRLYIISFPVLEDE